jgi:hypothetical protein
MDKDTKKGLGILGAIVAFFVVLYFFGAAGGDNKAACIAKAMQSKMERANVHKHCKLTG